MKRSYEFLKTKGFLLNYEKKACVIGYGNIGTVHSSILDGFGALYAVCDADGERLKRACEKYKNIKTYSDFDAVLNDKSIDAVHICTPHYLHAPMTEKGAFARQGRRFGKKACGYEHNRV
ncbi:MAG: Gfo/Idh/MocA family oxidoreductase [Clostridiales bacterium]|nr:MAG: Gfo/Idh/MocA family oxidoreductase [Clostridiales bacterium]